MCFISSCHVVANVKHLNFLLYKSCEVTGGTNNKNLERIQSSPLQWMVIPFLQMLIQLVKKFLQLLNYTLSSGLSNQLSSSPGQVTIIFLIWITVLAGLVLTCAPCTAPFPSDRVILERKKKSDCVSSASRFLSSLSNT